MHRCLLSLAIVASALSALAPAAAAGPAPDARNSVLAMARASDILVVACRAEPANRGLISAEVIEAVGPAGLIVNVSRGSLIDEQ